MPATREFLAAEVNKRGGAQVTPDDIIFFNGIGDAVAKVYGFLRREARVIGPTPAYSTHSSAEAAHSGYEHLTYELDPHNKWMPDLDDLRMKVKYNDSIAAILLINPDNPTGAVYPREVLEEIVDIAREFDLFLIADEIYTHIVYNGQQDAAPVGGRSATCAAWSCAASRKEVPVAGVALRLDRGPQPRPRRDVRRRTSTRCWPSKRLEVCSTTAPQMCVPRIMGDARYPRHLQAPGRRSSRPGPRRRAACSRASPACSVNCPSGAFYMTVAVRGRRAERPADAADREPARSAQMVEGLVAGRRRTTSGSSTTSWGPRASAWCR